MRQKLRIVTCEFLLVFVGIELFHVEFVVDCCIASGVLLTCGLLEN